MRFTSLIMVISFLLPSGKSVSAQPNRNDLLLKSFLSTDSPHRRYRLAIKIFQKASDESLKSMMKNESDDVAIGAAWESVLRASDGQLGKGHEQLALDPDRTNSFIRFIERRLRLNIPPEWKRCCKSARSIGWNIAVPANADLRETYEGTGPSGDVEEDETPYHLMSALVGIKVNYGIDGFNVKIHDDEVTIDHSVIDWLIFDTYDTIEEVVENNNSRSLDELFNNKFAEIDHVSGCSTKNDLFIAFHGDFPSSRQKLLCYDKSTHSLKWKSEVWAGIPLPKGGYSGIHHHYIFWASRDDAVFLFGTFTNCLYIEGFRLSDGKNIFRFHSVPSFNNE